MSKKIIGREGDAKCPHQYVLRGKLRETHNLNFCRICGREEILTDSEESAESLKTKFRNAKMEVD